MRSKKKMIIENKILINASFFFFALTLKSPLFTFDGGLSDPHLPRMRIKELKELPEEEEKI